MSEAGRSLPDSSAGMGRLAEVRKLAFCGARFYFSVGSFDGIETHPIDPSRTEDIIQANVIDKSLWLLSNSILLV
jgi:hypothetical protein